MTSRRAGVRDREPGPRPVEYPTSDGKPMAETDLHVDEIIRLRTTLRAYFANQPLVYVSGNLFCYYEEGNPRASFSPDLMVVFGTAQHQRDTYKLWEEPTPTVVIDVTSRKTRREDVGRKRDLYAQLGIAEYFLYDPRAEYLRPALQGFRLTGGEYRPVPPDSNGAAYSVALGLRLALIDRALCFVDPTTNQALPSPDERAIAAERQAIVEAEARRFAEGQARIELAARQAAEARGRGRSARTRSGTTARGNRAGARPPIGRRPGHSPRRQVSAGTR